MRWKLVRISGSRANRLIRSLAVPGIERKPKIQGIFDFGRNEIFTWHLRTASKKWRTEKSEGEMNNMKDSKCIQGIVIK